MAPARTKKARKSTESESSMIMSFPIPSGQTLTIKAQSPARTPPNKTSIRRPVPKISLKQKQALIDNLQLEITDRARKLRAIYSMQAQGLRSRIELRVNRIPTALRKVTMGELLAKYVETVVSKQQPAPVILSTAARKPVPPPAKNLLQQGQSGQSPASKRPSKRQSDEVIDKENDDLAYPKKRARVPDVPDRTTSKAQESQVLSPRSANSRTFVRPPLHAPSSPQKSFLARPISPLKPQAPGLTGGASSMLHNMVEKAKTSRAGVAARKATASSTTGAGTARGRKPATVAAAVPKGAKTRLSNSSMSSDASSGTVVTVPAKSSPVKRTVMGTIKGLSAAASKKSAAAAAAKAATAAATPAGRVLRKRT